MASEGRPRSRPADPCVNCGHTWQSHSRLNGSSCLVGRTQATGGESRCGCLGFERVTGGRLSQCQARHGQHMTLRCTVMMPESVAYDGHQHAGFDAEGNNVDWPDLVAMWPAIDDGGAWGDEEHVARAIRQSELDEGGRSAREGQVGGEHYRKYKIQPWDIIDEYGLDFYAGNALKYLLRNKADRLEDLKKARHYLDKLIELEEGGRGGS